MFNVNSLIKSIIDLPIGIPQDQMQIVLDELYKKNDIEAVMEALFQWEMKTGYITDVKLNSNFKNIIFDPEYQVSFRLQVNITRSKYSQSLEEDDNSGFHCQICPENIGAPGKENLRAFFFPIDGQHRDFFLHPALFPLFPNHYILVYNKKKPMKINLTALHDLFNFTDMAPDYTNCSNSDLECTGASILQHLHYQVFHDLRLPVMDAGELEEFAKEKDEVRIVPLHYPCGVIKLASANRENIIKIMNDLITRWKKMNPEKQSVNLIVTKTNTNIYKAYIFLRNADYLTPLELQTIKKEGVGIIEMAGEAILPLPEGKDEQKIWAIIKRKGLSAIKGIIEGNNPIKDKDFWKTFL